jgi:hypothetical protein
MLAKMVEVKVEFDRFKPTASKVAEEQRRTLSKEIATQNGMDHEAEFKQLFGHVRQRELGVKIRRMTRNSRRASFASSS